MISTCRWDTFVSCFLIFTSCIPSQTRERKAGMSFNLNIYITHLYFDVREKFNIYYAAPPVLISGDRRGCHWCSQVINHIPHIEITPITTAMLKVLYYAWKVEERSLKWEFRDKLQWHYFKLQKECWCISCKLRRNGFKRTGRASQSSNEGSTQALS